MPNKQPNQGKQTELHKRPELSVQSQVNMQPELSKQPQEHRQLELSKQPQLNKQLEFNKQPQERRQLELNKQPQLNKQPKLSPRLQLIADFIEKGAAVADIGTDHGLLPIYLVLNNLASGVTASDISEGSLHSAVKNAGLYGLNDQISFVRAPGLTGISENDADTIVVAGVGGETIIEILSGAQWLKQPDIRCVLQPQSKLGELCNWLDNNGYTICDAKLTLDRGRYYCVLLVAWDGGSNCEGTQTCVASPAKYNTSAAHCSGSVETTASHCADPAEATVAHHAGSDSITVSQGSSDCETALYSLLVNNRDPLAEEFLTEQLTKIKRILHSIKLSGRPVPAELNDLLSRLTSLKEGMQKNDDRAQIMNVMHKK